VKAVKREEENCDGTGWEEAKNPASSSLKRLLNATPSDVEHSFVKQYETRSFFSRTGMCQIPPIHC
jgi:hypothetical protein